MATAEDMQLLHDAAVLNARIAAMYRRIKTHARARYFTYVLLLQQGKMYVGSTDNVYARLADHVSCSEHSSKWVREWGPPIRVVEIVRDSAPDTERLKYAEYADKFGWENVRGAGFCQVFMWYEPDIVKTFSQKNVAICGESLDRREIDDIMAKVHSL